MFQNIKELYGDKLAASDGEIGHVKDFYFDDQNWVIRYLVVNTGSWLSERLVLLTPHVFGHLDRDKKLLTIQLTRKNRGQSIHRYASARLAPIRARLLSILRLACLLAGRRDVGHSRISGCQRAAGKKEAPHHGHNQRDDLHLRSTQSVTGYEIQASDGPIGSVRSFMVDDKSWAIGELVVETGHWYSGKEVMIAPSKIQRISYEESKVFVNLTKSDIERTAKDDVVKVGA